MDISRGQGQFTLSLVVAGPGISLPPQPCATCYQRQVVPPQYRTVEETVMVSPGAVIAHRTPPQYATRQRVEMVAPAREYYVATPPRCFSCGY
jgi:hypothetical protein